MLSKILNMFKWNNNREEITDNHKTCEPKPKKEELMDVLDMSKVEDVYPVSGVHDYNKKTILLVDDYKAMESLYDIAFLNFKENYKKDVNSDFNIYKIFGEHCGIKALKLLHKIKIDYAILDLTLGEIIKIESCLDDKYVCLDGVDIANELYKVNKDCKTVFVTAHNLNSKYDKFKMFRDKFKLATNKDIEDYYINKLEEERDNELLEFIYE